MAHRGGRRTVLVTGGSGFLGSALVRRLVAEGHAVRVLDDNSRGRAARLDGVPGVDFVPGDIRDAVAVTRATAGVDVVCHLAYVNGTRYFYEQPALVLDVAVKGMVNVLDACRTIGVRELLLVSSSEVYHDPPHVPTDELVPLTIPDVLNPRFSYAAGKMISEMLAINAGRHGFDRVVVVRPHNVYGPDMGREHVIPELVERLRDLAASTSDRDRPIRLPIQGSGAETRAFVYVDDFIDGLSIALSRGEHLGIYHVGTQDEVSIRELAERIARALGLEIEVVPGELRAGSPQRRCPDVSKIAALGYAPRITLDDGLARVVAWHAAQPISALPDSALPGGHP